MAINNYWWLMIWILGAGLVFTFIPKLHYEYGRGQTWKLLPAFVLMIPYVIWAGFRTTSWGDTGNYVAQFNSAPSTLSEIFSYIPTVEKDKGYTVLIIIFKSLFSSKSEYFFLFIAIIQIVCLLMVFRKYSSDYWLSMFLFVAYCDYMSWMHNGSREFLAVTLVFAATTFIEKKRYVPTIILIIIAATIHATALMMLPIIFIVQGKAWNRKTILAIIAMVLVVIYIDRFTSLLNTALSETQYSTAVEQWTSSGDNGTNPLRVLMYGLPTIVALWGRRFIRTENYRIINIAVNFSVVSTCIYIVSVFSSGIFIGRLPIYCSLYATGILLPWEIDNIFDRRSSRMIKGVLILVFIFYFYYQMHYAWNLL